MSGVACNQDGCIAVGGTPAVSPSRAAWWTSTDGFTWTRAGHDESLGDVAMERVALAERGAVAIGWANTPLSATSSVNRGAFWVAPPVTLPPPIPAPDAPIVGGHWETLPPMHTPRAMPAVTVGRDGRIYVFGGATRPSGSRTVETSSVEIFDPTARSWTFGTPIPPPARGRAAAVTASNGRIYLFHWSSRRVFVYDPKGATWAVGPSLPPGRTAAGAVAGPGRLLTVMTAAAGSLRVDTLNPLSGRWISSDPVDSRAWGAFARGADGLLYSLKDTRAWVIDPEL